MRVRHEAQPAGVLIEEAASSSSLGEKIRFTVYLPAGYGDTPARYPSLYLLHGRGHTNRTWTALAEVLDALIGAGRIPPLVVVLPDAPWSDRGSWYVDSRYTGTDPAAGGPGRAVETALVRDLVPHIDATYRTVDAREARGVGGFSMGAAGALRFALSYQGIFSFALVLSPAVYVPTPPAESTSRTHGAFGVGETLFDQARFDELNYPAGLAALDPALGVRVFIAVGDDPADVAKSAQLYDAVHGAAGVSAELRVFRGGHDWGVWRPALRDGLIDLARHLAEDRLRGTLWVPAGRHVALASPVSSAESEQVNET